MSVQPAGRESAAAAGPLLTPVSTALAVGRPVRSVDIGACAAAGLSFLPVQRRPRVAVLAGGDELVPLGTQPLPHQVVDSNTPMLTAAVPEAGGEPVVIGSVPDDPDALRAALLSAASCDRIVSTAGVSVGVHDHVRRVLADIGRIEVWGVAARPGKPLVIGAVGHTPFLGLPGNPVSSAVMFELFARTAIRAMQGAAETSRRRLAVRLGEPVATPKHLETFLRVALSPARTGSPSPTSAAVRGPRCCDHSPQQMHSPSYLLVLTNFRQARSSMPWSWREGDAAAEPGGHRPP
jgi:molybdenum cofactor synthesis domain-containing protein